MDCQPEANRPIGFFDSGVGGITVLKAARAALPHERFIYYGDSANAPYGTRSSEDILACTRAGVDALVGRGIKLLVIACNTATSVAAQPLRRQLDIPVVAMEPALKPASRYAGRGRVVVLATQATLALPRFRASMAEYGQNAVALPVYGLVECIESGQTNGPQVERCLSEALAPMLGEPIGAVVLGCTHYPFVRAAVEALVPGAAVLDGAGGTVRQVERLLAANDLACRQGRGAVDFYSSSPEPGAVAVMRRLFEAYAP